MCDVGAMLGRDSLLAVLLCVAAGDAWAQGGLNCEEKKGGSFGGEVFRGVKPDATRRAGERAATASNNDAL